MTQRNRISGKTPVGDGPAATPTEHAQAPAVVRVVQLVGVSDKSWSDAAQQVVARASRTIRHITGVDLLHSTATVRDGQIAEYHVNVKVAFVVEPAEIKA